MSDPPTPEAAPEGDVDIVFLAAAYERAQKSGMPLAEYFQRLARCFTHRPPGVGWKDSVPGLYGHLAKDGNSFRDLPTLIQRYLIARFPDGTSLRVPAANWKYGEGFRPPKPPTNNEGEPDFSGLSFAEMLKYLPGRAPGSVGPQDTNFPETTDERDRRLIIQALSDRKRGAAWESIEESVSRETGLSLSQLRRIFQSAKERERHTRNEKLRREFGELLEDGIPSGEAADLLARKIGLSARQIQSIVTRRSKPDK